MVASGDSSSIFSASATATGKKSYTLEELHVALGDLVNRTTDEEKSLRPNGLDHPQSRAFKSAVLYAFMLHFGMQEIHFQQSVGSIPGIFISPEFWDI